MAELFRGRIGPIGLPAIFQLIEMERLTGWMRLDGGALVGFVGGAPVYARNEALTGYEAVISLFFLDDVAFSLDQEVKPHGEPIAPIFDLVLEGCRRRDLWDTLSKVVLWPADAKAPPPRGPVGRVVPWLDGKRSLATAVQQADQSPSVLVDAVANLVDQGKLLQQRSAMETESEELLVSALLARGEDRKAMLTESTVPPDGAPSLGSIDDGLISDFTDHGPIAAFEAVEPIAALEAEPIAALEAEPIAALEAEPIAALEADDPPTSVHDSEDTPSRRRAMASPLAELGLTRSTGRDSQGRAFLAWAMKRGLSEARGEDS